MTVKLGADSHAVNDSIDVLRDDSVDPAVRGFLHSPENPNGDALILTHGAGSDSTAPLLVALSEIFAGDGYVVLRCDLPFRQERRTGPPFPGNAERDRAGLRNAVAVLRKKVAGRVFLGGHSYGGRQATILCASDDLPFRQERRTGPPFPGNAERDRAGLRNAVAVLRKKVAGRVFLGGHSYGGRQATILCASERRFAMFRGGDDGRSSTSGFGSAHRARRLLLPPGAEVRWRSCRVTCRVGGAQATLAAQLAGRSRRAEGIRGEEVFDRRELPDALGCPGRALVRPRGNAALRGDAA